MIPPPPTLMPDTHVIFKLLEISDHKNTLKTPRSGEHITCRGKQGKDYNTFFLKTIQFRRQWTNTLKVLKVKHKYKISHIYQYIF